MHLVPIPQDGNVKLPDIVLPQIAESVIASTVQLYAKRGYVEPWVGFLAVEEGKCVGACGFTAPPAEDSVEIAYMTLPDSEGHGVATRMAQRLITIALERDPSVNVIAYTLPEKNASNHILGKLGFAFSGPVEHPEDGHIWKWTYDPTLAASAQKRLPK